MNLGIETESLEFKKSTSEIKEACASICAMLNKHGLATVCFGVNPRGDVVGQEISEKTLREVSQRIAQAIKPQVFPTIAKEEIEGLTIIKVEVNGDGRPYSSNGRYYMRVSDEDREIDPEELRKLFANNSSRTKWEREETEWTARSIDKATLQRFQQNAEKAKRLPSGTKADTALLKQLGLFTGTRFNKAGTSLFSKHAGVTLKMAIFATNEKLTFLDLVTEEDNILNLLEKAETYILKNIRWRSDIVGTERIETPEIPVEVVREVLANSFAHALYGTNTYHEICIYPDHITVYNPGSFANSNTPYDYVHKNLPSVLRNELIAKVLYLNKSIEQFGSGFKRINSLCRDGGISYSYENTENGFLFLLRRSSDKKNVTENVSKGVSLNTTEKLVYDLLCQNNYLTRTELSGKISKTTRTVQRALDVLKEKGHIKREGSPKTGRWVITK